MAKRSTSSHLLAALAVLSAIAASGVARGNGAFPDAESILLPADDPAALILATNFGVVVSEDAGATWLWSCETNAITGGQFYGLGAGPRPRLYTVAIPGLAYTDDRGCVWKRAAGALTGAGPVDVFPDPNDPARVWAAAIAAGDASVGAPAVYLSRDRGATFDPPLLTLAEGASLTGLEVARSDPRVVYVAFREPPGLRPRLARSDDGGTTWTTVDLEPTLGRAEVRILGVDRADARRLFVRVIPEGVEHPADRLAVSTDAGATWTTPVTVDGGRLTAFLQRADGTILVAGLGDLLTSGFGTPFGRRSRDGGKTFDAWALGVHARGLAERGASLYAATDDLADRAAVQVSADEGATWTPLLTYANVRAIRACSRAACFEDCLNKAALRLWDEAICRAAAPVGDAGTDAKGVAGPSGGGGGCSCGIDRDRGGAGWWAALPLLLALRAARRRRPPA